MCPHCFLNLPKKITFSTSKYNEYTYDASVAKLSQKVVDGGMAKVSDYVGGFVYENNARQFLQYYKGDKLLRNSPVVPVAIGIREGLACRGGWTTRPLTGIASPINRTNPGFIGGGRTAGGAREFVIPNQAIPKDAVRRVMQ